MWLGPNNPQKQYQNVFFYTSFFNNIIYETIFLLFPCLKKVFQEVFGYLIEEFKTYKPIFSAIKNEYEVTLGMCNLF